ncbi:MAG: small multi-drug export protein [Oscillibacter sp.]|nr:small multi-drug export protein [Oscillibacter sp.]
MEYLPSLESTDSGKLIAAALVSMIPVLELRGGIPFGVGLGLHPLKAWVVCVLGNMLPVPLIIVYIRRIFQWLRATFPRLGTFIDSLERKAHLKGRTVLKYRYLGLFLFVALPLPGTGGWTGALVAAFLNMRLKNAFLSIFSGLVVAGFIVTLLTSSLAAMFG